ncbi:hypothetical protein BRPE64_BCDS05030 [Caballeronia insecticola]|uniref:Uncharacterized protein n=1 Tax=Caballeronia insecticola TaxID=758793 RepID=R4WL24_9BURK|nr:hypothetical protein BRPE64_BCDS05030 [Caballeronia insecticola]
MKSEATDEAGEVGTVGRSLRDSGIHAEFGCGSDDSAGVLPASVRCMRTVRASVPPVAPRIAMTGVTLSAIVTRERGRNDRGVCIGTRKYDCHIDGVSSRHARRAHVPRREPTWGEGSGRQ